MKFVYTVNPLDCSASSCGRKFVTYFCLDERRDKKKGTSRDEITRANAQKPRTRCRPLTIKGLVINKLISLFLPVEDSMCVNYVNAGLAQNHHGFIAQSHSLSSSRWILFLVNELRFRIPTQPPYFIFRKYILLYGDSFSQNNLEFPISTCELLWEKRNQPTKFPVWLAWTTRTRRFKMRKWARKYNQRYIFQRRVNRTKLLRMTNAVRSRTGTFYIIFVISRNGYISRNNSGDARYFVYKLRFETRVGLGVFHRKKKYQEQENVNRG